MFASKYNLLLLELDVNNVVSSEEVSVSLTPKKYSNGPRMDPCDSPHKMVITIKPRLNKSMNSVTI